MKAATPQERCEQYMREKLEQLAGVVEMKYSGAVEGAKEWGRIHKPELVDRCDSNAEEHLGGLMANEQEGEFRSACVDFFRAELELYRAYAEYLGLLEAA